MSYQTLKGKDFSWHHVSHLDDADFEYFRKQFKFHPLDFDDVRDETEIPKMENYRHYLFVLFTIPKFNSKTSRVAKENLCIFISGTYVVTITRTPIESVDRFFSKAKRGTRLRRHVMGKSTGYFLYQLLDYVFKDAKDILQELVREANNVEQAVYDVRTQVTTKRLGIVRGNVLFMRQAIDPQRMLVDQIMNTRKTYLSKDLDLYYEDVKDTLDSMWVISDNLKNTVDGLFDVNEAFLSHRTNEIIRLLTVISVILLPATLITGYFGMNVERLPFAEEPIVVTVLILSSILLFWITIFFIDRRK